MIFVKNRILLVITTITILIFLAIASAGCGDGTTSPREERVTAHERLILRNVNIYQEIQFQFDNRGRQKSVIWVKNNTDRILVNGELRVIVTTWNGEHRGDRLFERTVQEDFYITKPIHPGMRTWAILWFYPQPSRETGHIWFDVDFQLVK